MTIRNRQKRPEASVLTRIPSGEVTIAPSLLSADFSQLATEMRRIARTGCRWLHLDVMDNHFVPNLTFGPPVIAALRKVSRTFYFDAHLMTEDPMSLVDELVRGGVQNITIHQEACGDGLADALKAIRAAGVHAGVSIKPKTPVSEIESVLSLADLVLVMTVEPGFGGQPIIPSCLNKFRTLRRLRDTRKLKFRLQADGGVNVQTAYLAAAAGAEILVAGSAVFQGGAIDENVAALKRAAVTAPE